MKSLNIVFAGTPAFALPSLEAIFQSHHHLQAVYTQPDRPAGRGRNIKVSDVKAWAQTHNVPVYQPVNFKEQHDIDTLTALCPDVLIVIAYGLILPKTVLQIPRLGCINVHASLLPRWRGAAPIQYAILHGDKETGISIMQMDTGMDTGDILAAITCQITPLETAASLHDKLANSAPGALLQTLNTINSVKASAIKQNQDKATYAPKISKEAGRIHWDDPAIAIDRQIRAFNPWPIATTLANNEQLRIHEAKVLPKACSQAPGTIEHIDKQGIRVATGKNTLLITRIQFPGKRAIAVSEWLNANQNHLYPQLVLL